MTNCEILKNVSRKYVPNKLNSSVYHILEVGLSPSLPQIVLFASIKTLKMMKNAFYFILVVLFVLKLLKFSSWLLVM